MSKSKHESDDLNLKGKHHRAKKSTEGGRCLAPYGAYAKQSCSYRFQAYMQALREPTVYNGYKYASLGRKGKHLILMRQRKPAKGEKRWERKRVAVPREGDWDVSETSPNFQRSCNKPYWFEAHHIVPHSQLNSAVARVGLDKPNAYKLLLVVRRGLLNEGYNLNHMANMFILPMDGLVAEALKLPKHLATPSHRDHPRYCSHVEGQLRKFFNPVQETLSKHETKVNYRPTKEKLENLSKRLRGNIKRLGKTLWKKREDVTLDDISPRKKGLGKLDV